MLEDEILTDVEKDENFNNDDGNVVPLLLASWIKLTSFSL